MENTPSREGGLMAIEPLKQKPPSGAADPADVRIRDLRETAAKASKDRDKAKLDDASETRTQENERMRAETRARNVEMKKEVSETAQLRQKTTDEENRRIE